MGWLPRNVFRWRAVVYAWRVLIRGISILRVPGPPWDKRSLKSLSQTRLTKGQVHSLTNVSLRPDKCVPFLLLFIILSKILHSVCLQCWFSLCNKVQLDGIMALYLRNHMTWWDVSFCLSTCPCAKKLFGFFSALKLRVSLQAHVINWLIKFSKAGVSNKRKFQAACILSYHFSNNIFICQCNSCTLSQCFTDFFFQPLPADKSHSVLAINYLFLDTSLGGQDKHITAQVGYRISKFFGI